MIEHLREELYNPQTKERFRQSGKAFSRQWTLTFARVVLLVLRGHPMALQNALNKVFTALGEVFGVPTASAYSQARQKLKPEVFVHLSQIVCRDFYPLEAAAQASRWRGHRLLACDGTYLTVPGTAQTRARYRVQTNQYPAGACVQALGCVLYDLRNELALAATLGPRQGEKHRLLMDLWSATALDDGLVLDRHYADYTVIAWAVAHQRHVCVRLPARTFRPAMTFWQSALPEQIVTLDGPASARKFVQAHGLPEQRRGRLIRVVSDTGETEGLLTTLLDAERYPAAEFKSVYGWRWGEETFFSRIKNLLDVERFSGTTVAAIEQDFYGLLFLANLESGLSRSDQAALAETGSQRQTQTTAQVNHAVRYATLLDRVVPLLLSDKPIAAVLDEWHHLFRTNPTRARPGRQVERPKGLRYAYRLRFHKYVKKIIA